MISPETLRKYVFFGFLADDEFAKLAVFAGGIPELGPKLSVRPFP